MDKNSTLFYVCNTLEDQQPSVIYANKLFDDLDNLSDNLNHINYQVNERIIDSILDYAKSM